MSHPPYEILEHTADVGLKAYGRTLPELFVNAAVGMIALALEPLVAPVSSGVEGSEAEPQ
ncbi:MAG: archease, partial [Terriglobia bacterium]